ncbi:tripartite tricarboxylate transporter substrate binding protein [Roseiarcaceae bacterium H3SJ34-1]|uniref:Bug family tripartite tricarboxylate transporter substrate binding protein n=1 Tax=Terripilifer ovatus TaxID=3032367 RepID=UPI003AB9B18E|nr:tripartite tricarboxylate transporter substrate binding protein [Roseiarcaceae bacterium H3SJ34-1]
MRRFACKALFAIAMLSAWAAQAQTFPDHPLKLIVPQPPGGGFDTAARIVADRLQPLLGQGVVVENRTGAGTLVGTEAAARAPADGYTMLLGGLANIALNPGLYDKLSYDPLKDFKLVSLVVSNPYMLIGRPDLPQKSLKEVIDYARANPQKVTYASGGRGTGQHIAMAVTAQLAGVKLTHVPYRGAQAAYQDILGGRVDLFFDNWGTARPLVEDKRVIALAASSAKRIPAAPDVPTVAEAGIGDLDMETWFGIFVPSATPQPVLERLRTEVRKVAAMPDVITLFEKTGGRPLYAMPIADMEALIARDVANFTRLIRAAGITGE